ncbi:TIR domain-containing protein, partial [Anabaena sp. UHCC 0399]|uniref:TIR domain-containing protein n=1 Tax=Anabaena sp. UHCC 0399 TaxID=3110238 RepID=UPI002B1FB873
MNSIEVFISYHQQDEELRQELEKHLASLRQENLIASWHDRKIIPGQEIKREIDQHLNQAGLILLLISSDFLDSEYHWTVEVTRALQQNAAKKACVIPVLLRHVDLGTGRLTELLPLPKNRKPIKNWADRDEAFFEVAKGIREAIAPLMAQLVSSDELPQKETTKAEEDLQYRVTELLNEADRLYEDKNFEGAILKYKAVLSLDLNSVYAHHRLGNALSA